MEHIAAILLLVGCSGDLQQCEELPAQTAIYETGEDCRADLSSSLAQVKGRNPRIFGACVYADPALEQGDAELVWDIGRDGTLHVAIETPSVVVATNATRRQTSGQQ